MAQRQTATRPKFVSPETFLRENRGVVGRTLFYDAIRRGEVPHVRIGRRILVPVDCLDRMLAAGEGPERPARPAVTSDAA